MNLEMFEILVRTRRSCRHFQEEPLPEGMLERLLDCARWAPSGYNLQPVHFVTVTDPQRKRDLFQACMKQKQVVEAPVIVIFAGNSRPMADNFNETVRMDHEVGAMTREYEKLLRKYVPLAFSAAPLGLGRVAKTLAAPVLGWLTPTPSIPVVHPRFWVTKQVMLSSMNFMMAAHAAGLATVPMEGFDEGRVKQIAGIPAKYVVPVVVPVGYAEPGEWKKSRLPLARMWHREKW